MSARSSNSLRVVLGRSRRLAWLLGIAYGGAMVLAWLLPIPWLLRFVIAGAAAIGLWVALREHAFRSAARAVVDFEIDEEGMVALRFANAMEWAECRIEDSWVHPQLVLLAVAGEGRQRTRIAIAPDALPGETFRRLRVWLRLRTAAG